MPIAMCFDAFDDERGAIDLHAVTSIPREVPVSALCGTAGASMDPIANRIHHRHVLETRGEVGGLDGDSRRAGGVAHLTVRIELCAADDRGRIDPEQAQSHCIVGFDHGILDVRSTRIDLHRRLPKTGRYGVGSGGATDREIREECGLIVRDVGTVLLVDEDPAVLTVLDDRLTHDRSSQASLRDVTNDDARLASGEIDVLEQERTVLDPDAEFA